MKEETIRMLCDKKGMGNNDLFVKFFMKAFPNESDEIHSYCNEWIDRFQNGNPLNSMDIERRKIYKELIKNWE